MRAYFNNVPRQCRVFIIITTVSLLHIAAARDAGLLISVKRGDVAAVRTLIGQHIDVNAVGADSMTALHWAVVRDDLAMANVLLGAGADVNATTRLGVTALILACTNGSVPLIGRLLDAGADANAASPGGQTALMTAARSGRADGVKALLARGARVNDKESWKDQTALMWAAAEDHVGAVRVLLDAGADVHARSKTGLTALLFAARNGQLAAAEVLLAAGADVNDSVRSASGARVAAARATDTGPDGSSALALAIINTRYAFARMLLDHGADPDVADARGSLLHTLAWMRRPGKGDQPESPQPTADAETLELGKALLDAGASPNLRVVWKERKISSDRPEVTGPSNIASGRNYISLVGATPFFLAAKHSDVAYMRLLASRGADPLMPTVQGVTPLMAAAGFGWYDGETPGPVQGIPESESLAAVKLAVELGNDVNAVTDFGPQPVEGDGVFLLTNNPKNFEALVDAGALGDMRWGGSTALHGAALRAANSIVQCLVDKGARLDAKNQAGWTPLSVASGILIAGTLKDWPATAALLRQLMVERGLNPSDSIICSVCKEFTPSPKEGPVPR